MCLLPLCMTYQMNIMSIEKSLIYFKSMQQIMLIPSLILCSYLYNIYADKEYKEVINSIDRTNRYIYIVMHYIYIQLLHLPFYMILIIICPEMLMFILIYCIQMIVIFSVYYLLTKFIHHSLVVLMIMLLYILIYSLVLFDVSFGNIFLIYVPVYHISKNYYLFMGLIWCLSVFIGILVEKRIINIEDYS